MFAKPNVLLCFNQMVDAYSSRRVTKASEVITLHRSTMSSNKHNAMTLTAINELMSRSHDLATTLSQSMATPVTVKDCNNQLQDIRKLMKKMNNSFESLLNLRL